MPFGVSKGKSYTDQYGDQYNEFSVGGKTFRALPSGSGETNKKLFGEADIYRNALEKAAYGGASREFGQGLQAIQGHLAGAGPLADSGAANAMRSKLLSGVYGAAQGRIQNSFADYIKQALNSRQQYRYQQQLQKQAQKAANKFNPLAAITGAASYVIPGLKQAAPALSGYDAAIAAGPEYNWNPRG